MWLKDLFDLIQSIRIDVLAYLAPQISLYLSVFSMREQTSYVVAILFFLYVARNRNLCVKGKIYVSISVKACAIFDLNE